MKKQKLERGEYGYLKQRKNRALLGTVLMVLIGFAIFGISIQIFMPYLIIYYEKSLEMTNYVLVMAPAIILAA